VTEPVIEPLTVAEAVVPLRAATLGGLRIPEMPRTLPSPPPANGQPKHLKRSRRSRRVGTTA
jgi:hypothetical protein